MGHDVLPGFGMVTIFLLLLIFLTLVGRGGQLTETRLVLIGLFVSIAAMLWSLLSSLAVREELRNVPIAMELGGGALNPAGVLMRIGLILVLAGVGLFLHRKLGPQLQTGDTPEDVKRGR